MRLTGGTGPSYPSFTVAADSARTAGSRWRGVLALYSSPHGGPPALEIRVKRMCRTPPYNRQHNRDRLTAGLHALSILRLDRETDLSRLRPEIPLSELTADSLACLLALIDHWISDVRAHAAEPETDYRDITLRTRSSNRRSARQSGRSQLPVERHVTG